MNGDCEMCGEYGDYLVNEGAFWLHERCLSEWCFEVDRMEAEL